MLCCSRQYLCHNQVQFIFPTTMIYSSLFVPNCKTLTVSPRQMRQTPRKGSQKINHLPPPKVREGNVFTPVCQSFCSRGALPVWLPGTMFLWLEGISVLRRVSVKGGIVKGTEDSPRHWHQVAQKLVVHIILECILVDGVLKNGTQAIEI